MSEDHRVAAILPSSDLAASTVQIGQLSSQHAEIKFTGIRQARLEAADAKEGLMAMLRIALGQPAPGGALPVGLPPAEPT